MREELKKNDAGKYLDGFYPVTGKHFEIWQDPEKYAYLTDTAVEALDNKYNKEEQHA